MRRSIAAEGLGVADVAIGAATDFADRLAGALETIEDLAARLEEKSSSPDDIALIAKVRAAAAIAKPWLEDCRMDTLTAFRRRLTVLRQQMGSAHG